MPIVVHKLTGTVASVADVSRLSGDWEVKGAGGRENTEKVETSTPKPKPSSSRSRKKS